MTRVLTDVRVDADGYIVARMFHDAPLKPGICEYGVLDLGYS